MPMFTEEALARRPKSGQRHALPGHATCPGSSPSRPGPTMQARYPKLAEMFKGRKTSQTGSANFWGDGAEETCFTEMQVLAQHAGARRRDGPGRALGGPRDGGGHRPARPGDALGERPRTGRYSSLASASSGSRLRYCARTSSSSQEVWAPVDDMWQQALPVIEEAGRHLMAQYERGRSLETFIPPGCDILDERLPEIVANVEAGQPLLFVPCLFFGSSMYLEVSGLVVIGTGVGQGDVVARARTESVARRLKAVADPTRLALLHSLASAPSTVGELARALPAGPTHREHARQGVAPERVGALGTPGRAIAAERRRRGRRVAARRATTGRAAGATGAQPAGASTTGSDLMPATVVDSTLSAGPVTA